MLTNLNYAAKALNCKKLKIFSNHLLVFKKMFLPLQPVLAE
jgi:hypothetical protein